MSLGLLVGACSGTEGLGDDGSGSVLGGGDDGDSGLTGDNDGTVFRVRGPEGGPFPEDSRDVVLQNNSPDAIRWRAEATLPWLVFSRTQGGLAGGARTHVEVSIDPLVANDLPAGEYYADIYFRNRDDATDQVAIEFVLTVYEVSGDASMLVTPEDGFRAEGTVGGRVEPPRKGYRISNVGAQPMDFQLSTSQAWVLIDGDISGQIEAGEAREISVYFDEDALAALGEGSHSADVSFRNTTNGSGDASRPVSLTLRPDGRIVDGLQVLYSFDAGSGGIVHDESGVGQPLDLLIEDLGATQWLPGSLTTLAPTRVISQGPATKVMQACRQSGEITIEAWVRPSNVTQDGPARIVTLSDGAYERNFTLGQGLWGNQPSDVFDVRLRTSQTDLNGTPSTTSPAGTATTALSHVVYTRKASGQTRIFLNGQVVKTSQVAGNFSNWDSDLRLALANEIGASRPWQGTFHLLAVYGRALSESEVGTNYDQGTQDPGVGFLTVGPAGGFNSSGVEGGPFSPDAKTYTLENTGEAPLVWSAQGSESWVRVAGTTTGTLLPDQSVELDVELVNQTVGGFTPGTYRAVADFVNVTSGFGNTSREVVLTVSPEGGDGEVGEKPGPHNTGPTDPDILVPMSGTTITVDGITIENVDIHGTVNVAANNVTFRNFKADANGSSYNFRMDYGKTGIVFEDGELVGSSASAFYGRSYTLRRLNIHHHGCDAIKSSSDVTVERCWIHHLGMSPDSHADGNQTRHGRNYIFRYNNFDIPKGIPGHNSNASSITTTILGPVDNFLMEGNWLNGGNYTLYFEDKGNGPPTNVQLINNRFGRDYNHGVLVSDGPLFAQGNVWDDTGELMDINNH